MVSMLSSVLIIFILHSLKKHELNIWFWIISVLFTVVLVLFLMVYFELSRRFKHNVNEAEKEMYTTNIVNLDSLTELILKIYFMLEKVSKVETDPNLKKLLINAHSQIEFLQKASTEWRKIKDSLSRSEEAENLYKNYGISKINQTATITSAAIIEAVELFTNKYINSADKIQITQSELAILIYYLSNSIPLIGEFSDSSNRFSRDTIKEVITLFEEIAQFSMHISQDIQQKMKDLMDAERNDSLVYIIQQTHTLVDDFEEFFQSLEKLKNVSNNFADTSIEKLNNIADFAVNIEDIAETIKVISLNVSIEAANTGSSARGFQVLARDLRVFAQKTLKFAGDVKLRVQDTIESTQGLKEEYLDNMNIVYTFVQEMKDSIENFKTIIESSFERIQSIIMILQEFARKIDEGLKSVVGKLQYYDITSQEVEHLSQFIENIFETAKKGSLTLNLDNYISSEKRQDIQISILESINKIITTRNERKILNKYEEIYGTAVSERESESGITDDIILF